MMRSYIIETNNHTLLTVQEPIAKINLKFLLNVNYIWCGRLVWLLFLNSLAFKMVHFDLIHYQEIQNKITSPFPSILVDNT